MSKKMEELVNTLSGLTVLEMAELKKALEDHWGVTAAAPAQVVAAGAGAVSGEEEKASEEPTDFMVTLEEFPADKKIAVIKVIREVTGLPLKEAKEMAESTPKAVKESAPKAEAEDIKKKFEASGAKVSLKGV